MEKSIRLHGPITLRRRYEEPTAKARAKKEAATLGRTTDLRMTAETAIPRSTTELQQQVVSVRKFNKYNLVNITTITFR